MNFVVTRQKSLDSPPLFNGRSHCLTTVNADPCIKWIENNAYLVKMESEKKLFYSNGVGKGY